MISKELKEMLKRHEGFRQHPYLCTSGKTSVGYGRNLDDVGISEEEGEHLLMNDVYHAIRELDKYPWFNRLDDVRQDALIDFMFNVGPGTFKAFVKMRRALAVGDYEQAAAELLDSRYAEQVGKRAVELAYMLKNGLYIK